MKFLSDVIGLRIFLFSDIEPQTVNGNVNYKSVDGWEVIVFNDNGKWAHVSYLRAPDGADFCFDDIDIFWSKSGIRPTKEQSFECYGIPGGERRLALWKGVSDMTQEIP